jgi:SNF2 family DNA or RNA helicase
MSEQSWNPEIANQQVRLRRNPGKRGLTTGKIKKSAGRLLVFVNFGLNEKTFKPYDQLELCEEPEEIKDLLESGRFGTPDDLRRILTFEKVKGNLTNIFYSMESSNTDFYAYQFKPVLKFLDSSVGRLLIADEVGLGKTIESIYIWKELQAREDARRLLIVCPAMLRDKWFNDIKSRFNYDARVVNAKEILESTRSFSERGKPHTFIYITSLEGLRIKNWDEDVKNYRADLARLLEAKSNSKYDESSIFDLTIIDEAHYLRNPGTANNKLGQLLRDVSKHLLLLTATPIQIRSDNLFQLLRLISPEDFFDLSVFEPMLKFNQPIVDALRLLWRNSSNLNAIKEAVQLAQQSPYFWSSSRLAQVSQELDDLSSNSGNIEAHKRVRIAQLLESSSLFGQFMTRSRKREVMENRVQRAAQTLEVEFTPIEKEVYDYITYKIRIESIGKQTFEIFRLLARQRQMASCMVAALTAWKKNGVIDDFLIEDNNEELMYEIFGFDTSLDSEISLNNKEVKAKFKIPVCPFPEDDIEFNKFIQSLENHDTKYNNLVHFLQTEIRKNKQEKFVIFAYYRDTLTYLQDRLTADGINIFLIMGGLDQDRNKIDKQARITEFKNTNSSSVLLSSKVGSEGIDLQFCRFIINYDLPWNPMRVEQRIGRLDRLGQKADKISIINFNLKGTIEEYILEKLYNRIKIFEESIGDLEEILGEKTEELILGFLNPKLSDEELKLQAEQSIVAIANEMEQQRKLENEAINLIAFSDYIVNKINKSRSQGRWLRPEELKAFVEDFFKLQYPGTVITPLQDGSELYSIKLADEAKVDLRQFCNKQELSTPTRLHSQTVTCFFNPKIYKGMGEYNHELLSPTHPLIQWIRHKYEPESQGEEGSQSFQPVAASYISSKNLIIGSDGKAIEAGVYVYVIHHWQMSGLRKENRLAYKVIKLGSNNPLPDEIAEMIVNQVALEGTLRPNAINLIDIEQLLNTYNQCEELLQEDLINAEAEFEAENTDRCNVQENSAKAYAQRKIDEYEQRIQKFRQENKLTIIRAEEGKIKKVKQNLHLSLQNIKKKRPINVSNPALASGLIFVE